MPEDVVNHPSHYTKGKIEVIDFIEDQKLDYHEGNAVKYIARAKHKGNELQDLKKAVWYLNRRIEGLEKPGPKPSEDRRTFHCDHEPHVFCSNCTLWPIEARKPQRCTEHGREAYCIKCRPEMFAVETPTA